MSSATATLQTDRRPRFRAWEWALISLATPLFFAALAMYVSDFPILRKYVLKFEQTTDTEARVGELAGASGRVRRQRATESEFVLISPGESLQNQDTLVTDSGVSAQVRLDDGGTIELAADTMIKLAFDVRISIGGVTRQTNVQLVTGAVTGQTKAQKIVVETVTGKTTTLGSEAQAVVREAPVVPKKAEVVAVAIPVEVIEAAIPPPIEIAAEERKIEAEPPPPPPPPKPKILPATLTALAPAAGARIAPAEGLTNGHVSMSLAFTSSRPDGKFRVRLKPSGSWLGGTLLDERVEARAGKISIPVSLEKPGAYEWSIEDLDADDAPQSTQSFELLTEFQGLTLLDTSVPGGTALSNLIAGELLTTFPGFLLRWKTHPEAEDYEINIYRDQASSKPIFSGETSEPRLLFSKGVLLGGAFRFRVVARLKNGFRATSPTKMFQLDFLPPALAQPRNGAPIPEKKTGKAPVLLTWSHTNFTEKYEVQVSSDPSFAEVLDARSTGDNFHSFLPPAKGTYYWRVRARGRSLISTYSEPRNFTMR
jgi:hypothetical protein